MGNETSILYGEPGQYKVPIPKAIAQAVGLEKGERVEWRIVDVNRLELVRAKALKKTR